MSCQEDTVLKEGINPNLDGHLHDPLHPNPWINPALLAQSLQIPR